MSMYINMYLCYIEQHYKVLFVNGTVDAIVELAGQPDYTEMRDPGPNRLRFTEEQEEQK